MQKGYMKKFLVLTSLIIVVTLSNILAAPNAIQTSTNYNNSLRIIRNGSKQQDNWYSLNQVKTIDRVPQELYFQNSIFVKLKNKAAITTDKKAIRNSLLQSSIASLNINEIVLPYEKFAKKFANKMNNKNANGIDRIYKITYESPVDPYQVCADLMNNPDVEYATPIFKRRLCYTPNDPYFKDGTQYYMDLMQIKKAWDISKGSPDIKIAIIDVGTDWTHEDLIDNIWTNPNEIPDNGIDDDDNGYIDDVHGWDFVGAISYPGATYIPDNDPNPSDPDKAHGTHTAGLASASTDNSKGIAGTGFNCKIIPIKTSADTSIIGGILTGYEGILYASELGADIISCSWGGPGYSPAEEDIINTASAMGSLIVVASGNSGASLDNSTEYPAGYKNVLTVGSSIGSTLSSFSNYGIKVDVYAPGVNIMSTVPGNSYLAESGTSMATPIVAGVAALVKSIHPDWSPAQIAKQIRVTADRTIAKNDNDAPYYYGFVNAYKALNYNNTDTTLLLPGIKISDITMLNGSSIKSYDPKDVRATLKNYLSTGKNITITLIPEDSWVILPTTTFTIPEIATNSMQDIQFQIQLTDKTPWFQGATRIIAKIEGNNNYVDYDAITLPINLPTSNTFTESPYQFGDAGTSMNAMTMLSDGTGIIVSNMKISSTSNFSIINKVTSTGITTSYLMTDAFMAVHAFDINHFIIGTATDDIVGRSTIRKTTNGGNSWTVKDISTITNFVNYIHFYDDNNGIILGDPVNNIWGIAKTTDGGNTWNRIDGIPDPLANEDGLVGSGQFNGDQIWFGTTHGRIFYSKDQGNTWSVQNVGDSKPVVLVSFIDESRGIAVYHNSLEQITSEATLMITNDGGQTWMQSQTDVSGDDFYPVYCFSPAGSNNQYFLSKSGRVSVSNDNGNTFRPVLTKQDGIVALGQYQIINNKIKLWEVGTGVNYLLFDMTSSVYEPVLTSNIIVSPNPAYNFINIQVPQNFDQINSIYIMDMLGEKVLDCTDLRTSDNVYKIDVNSLSSGIYFVVISTNAKNYFEKVIISK